MSWSDDDWDDSSGSDEIIVPSLAAPSPSSRRTLPQLTIGTKSRDLKQDHFIAIDDIPKSPSLPNLSCVPPPQPEIPKSPSLPLSCLPPPPPPPGPPPPRRRRIKTKQQSSSKAKKREDEPSSAEATRDNKSPRPQDKSSSTDSGALPTKPAAIISTDDDAPVSGTFATIQTFISSDSDDDEDDDALGSGAFPTEQAVISSNDGDDDVPGTTTNVGVSNTKDDNTADDVDCEKLPETKTGQEILEERRRTAVESYQSFTDLDPIEDCENEELFHFDKSDDSDNCYKEEKMDTRHDEDKYGSSDDDQGNDDTNSHGATARQEVLERIPDSVSQTDNDASDVQQPQSSKRSFSNSDSSTSVELMAQHIVKNVLKTMKTSAPKKDDGNDKITESMALERKHDNETKFDKATGQSTSSSKMSIESPPFDKITEPIVRETNEDDEVHFDGATSSSKMSIEESHPCNNSISSCENKDASINNSSATTGLRVDTGTGNPPPPKTMHCDSNVLQPVNSPHHKSMKTPPPQPFVDSFSDNKETSIKSTDPAFVGREDRENKYEVPTEGTTKTLPSKNNSKEINARPETSSGLTSPMSSELQTTNNTKGRKKKKKKEKKNGKTKKKGFLSRIMGRSKSDDADDNKGEVDNKGDPKSDKSKKKKKKRKEKKEKKSKQTTYDVPKVMTPGLSYKSSRQSAEVVVNRSLINEQNEQQTNVKSPSCKHDVYEEDLFSYVNSESASLSQDCGNMIQTAVSNATNPTTAEEDVISTEKGGTSMQSESSNESMKLLASIQISSTLDKDGQHVSETLPSKQIVSKRSNLTVNTSVDSPNLDMMEEDAFSAPKFEDIAFSPSNEESVGNILAATVRSTDEVSVLTTDSTFQSDKKKMSSTSPDPIDHKWSVDKNSDWQTVAICATETLPNESPDKENTAADVIDPTDKEQPLDNSKDDPLSFSSISQISNGKYVATPQQVLDQVIRRSGSHSDSSTRQAYPGGEENENIDTNHDQDVQSVEKEDPLTDNSDIRLIDPAKKIPDSQPCSSITHADDVGENENKYENRDHNIIVDPPLKNSENNSEENSDDTKGLPPNKDSVESTTTSEGAKEAHEIPYSPKSPSFSGEFAWMSQVSKKSKGQKSVNTHKDKKPATQTKSIDLTAQPSDAPSDEEESAALHSCSKKNQLDRAKAKYKTDSNKANKGDNEVSSTDTRKSSSSHEASRSLPPSTTSTGPPSATISATSRSVARAMRKKRQLKRDKPPSTSKSEAPSKPAGKNNALVDLVEPVDSKHAVAWAKYKKAASGNPEGKALGSLTSIKLAKSGTDVVKESNKSPTHKNSASSLLAVAKSNTGVKMEKETVKPVAANCSGKPIVTNSNGSGSAYLASHRARARARARVISKNIDKSDPKNLPLPARSISSLVEKKGATSTLPKKDMKDESKDNTVGGNPSTAGMTSLQRKARLRLASSSPKRLRQHTELTSFMKDTKQPPSTEKDNEGTGVRTTSALEMTETTAGLASKQRAAHKQLGVAHKQRAQSPKHSAKTSSYQIVPPSPSGKQRVSSLPSPSTRDLTMMMKRARTRNHKF